MPPPSYFTAPCRPRGDRRSRRRGKEKKGRKEGREVPGWCIAISIIPDASRGRVAGPLPEKEGKKGEKKGRSHPPSPSGLFLTMRRTRRRGKKKGKGGGGGGERGEGRPAPPFSLFIWKPNFTFYFYSFLTVEGVGEGREGKEGRVPHGGNL